MAQHNLPKQLTPFIGREQAIAEIESRLQEADCRLLTLFGLGGIGKTRLAIRLGERQLSNFSDGVWFVRLQTVNSTDWIVPTIAETFHLSSGPEDPLQTLLSYLSDKELLLMFDNYEHLIDELGLSLLTDIVRVAPLVKLVVTSREALNIQEEWRYSVSGLSMPSSELRGSNDLDVHEATRLFTICARKVKPGLDLADEYADVVKICRLVDGVPLAIEMAASWLGSLSCRDVVLRVEHGKLDTRLRNVSERHRSMSAVFEQSWSLLGEDERDAFSTLCVFADGFRKEAAEVITQSTSHMLATLVDKSLLQLDASGRYNLHELIRQFGLKKLDKHPQKKAAVLDAHCDYYTAFLNDRKDRFRAQDSSEVMEELGKEIDNIRFAWQRAIATNRTQIIRETIWCLAEYYEIQTWYHEGDYMLGKAVDTLKMNDLTGTRGITLGLALVGRGNFLHYLGRMDEAKVLIRDGVSILQQLDAFAETAHALSLLGRFAWMTGDFKVANQAYRDSIALAEVTGDLVTLGFGYLNLSMIAVIQGNFQQSSLLKQTGLATFQQINHRLGIGIILCIKGEEQYLRGYYEQAKDFVLRASKIFVELDNQWHLSNCYENLGHIMFALGDYTDAVYHLSEAMSLAQEINDPRRITYCHVNMGDLLFADGKISEANQHYTHGLALAREAHQRLQEAWSLRGLGSIAYHHENYDLAQQYLSDSLNICRQTSWKIGMIKALNLLGSIASRMKDQDSATVYFLEALDTAILIKANPFVIETLVCIAEVLIDQIDKKSVVQILSEAMDHGATHAGIRKRADHLLGELRNQLPADIFAGLMNSGEAGDLTTFAERCHTQLHALGQQTVDEPLLERLTRTERRILLLMDSDLSYPEIAELQHVSINTIKTHRKNIFSKLDVNTREEAIARAKNLRLL